MKKAAIFLAIVIALLAHESMADPIVEAPQIRPYYLSSTANATTSEDWGFKLSLGADYTSGKYGQPTATEIWDVPVTGEITKGPWTFDLIIPWVTIRGNGSVVGAGDASVVTTGATGPVTTNSGLGDIDASLAYTFKLPDDLSLGLTGQVKFPTGDVNRNLGTGEYDFTGLFTVAKTFDKLTLLGIAGHRFTTTNQTFNTHDIWLADVGASYKFADKWLGGLLYDWREAETNATDNPSQLTPYVDYQLTDHADIQGYGIIGLSNGSPDLGVGAAIGYKFQ